MNVLYEILEQRPDRVLLRDTGEGLSITNGADRVVEELPEKLQSGGLDGRRLLYIDTLNRVDEILVRDGEFAGIKLL